MDPRATGAAAPTPTRERPGRAPGADLRGLALALATALVASAAGCLGATRERVGPPPDLSAAGDGGALVERGRYLGEHVAACAACHSQRDWGAFSGPVVAGTLGQGGEVYPEDAGYPGTLYAGNITPAALGGWTDGEVARAFLSGLTADGRPLFPVMPYPDYSALSAADAAALVAWIRALPPIDHRVPATDLKFPLNLIVRTIPQPWSPGPEPAPGDEIARGAYLARLGSCAQCHTQSERGEPLPGMELAGGRRLPVPGGTWVVSSNITPDPTTGIGAWSRETFTARFRAFASAEARSAAVPPGGPNTSMPWTAFAGMTDEDLGAIYAWLMTQAPVVNPVDPWGPAAHP